MLKVVVVGSSGHAGVVIDAMLRSSTVQIAGLLDDFLPPGTCRHDYPVLGPVDQIADLAQTYAYSACTIAVGDNWRRRELSLRVSACMPDVELIAVVHPASCVARSARLGAGAFVAAGSVVGPNSNIGAGCIVNTGATVDHDCRLDAFSSVAPGVHLGGYVHIEEMSAIGIGAVVSHGVAVGRHTVVGAGAVVVSDVPGEVVAYGVPARTIRSRRPDEPYL